MSRPLFVTLEGIEGVGKSTQLAFLHRHLVAAGVETVVTREPGGTPAAERIREILLDRDLSLPAEAELLLMFAARSAHVAELVRPALARGAWVVCDRFTDATRAYQGGGRGLPAERIEALARWVIGGLEPDLTLLLDAPVAEALGRVEARGALDRFESERAAFFERVRRRYLEIAAEAPARVRVIDASGPVEAVSERLAAIIDPMIENYLSKRSQVTVK